MMCVSLTVVGGILRFFCQGDLAIFGIVFFAIMFAFYAPTTVIISTIAAVLGVWERFLLTGVSFFLPS